MIGTDHRLVSKRARAFARKDDPGGPAFQDDPSPRLFGVQPGARDDAERARAWEG